MVGRNDDGSMAMRGIFGGNERDAFVKAAELSRRHNLTMLDKPIKKCVVYLDPHEFKSTWLGNKSVYRTRMAMADGGELVVLAPGLREFGEDKEIDRLIRKYGYKGTPATLDAVKKNKELSDNLSAAAHLIHGSSEGRFSITYCPGEGMSEKEIRSVGFEYCKFAEITKKYNPDKMKHGFNRMPGGEEIFFIGNPSIGLWKLKEKFC